SSFASGGGGHPPGEKAARGGRNIMGAGPLKGGGKRALCLLWVASLLILSGCWDRKELNEIALIRAIGIDRTEDGQVEVTLLQAIPQRAEDAGGGEKPGRSFPPEASIFPRQRRNCSKSWGAKSSRVTKKWWCSGKEWPGRESGR